MAETKVIYHVDEEETPYLVKVPGVDPSDVTLGDLKQVLRRTNVKYFFKAKDDDFGYVKEEISSDSARLPVINGKVICYLEHVGGSSNVQTGEHQQTKHEEEELGVEDSSVVSTGVGLPPPGLERGPGVGETRPPSFHGGPMQEDDLSYADTDTLLSSRRETNDDFEDTESSITSVSQAAARRREELGRRQNGPYGQPHRSSRPARLPGPGIPPPGGSRVHTHHRHNHSRGLTNESSTAVSSELESSLYDTEDAQSMASSRFTTSTDHTSVSQQVLRHRQKRRSKRRVPAHLARAGSISSVTDSTMSLNCITVTLNMDTVNFLGISIVGQSNKFGDGDCGIYVGSIMKGGAVALDGRIEPGDMILQVNEISFEKMSNDDAVRVLREVVQKPGPIKLVVAKCWESAPSKNYFTIPRTEPVRPIDPGAWVAHTAAVRGSSNPPPPESFIDGPWLYGQLAAHNDDGDLPMAPSHFAPHLSVGDYPGRCPSVTTLSNSSVVSSQPETEKYFPITNGPLTTESPPAAIIRAMRAPDSDLEVRDRIWLKITIKNAFIGSDLVDWLHERVQGFTDRKDAKKFACNLLKSGYIKHTVNKKTFSDNCYYAFGDDSSIAAGIANMTLENANVTTTTSLLPPTAPAGPVAPPPPVPWAPPATWGPPHPPQAQQQTWPEANHSSSQNGSIYNPTAPPPSANYGVGQQAAYGGFVRQQQQRSVASSGDSGHSLGGSQRHLRLAGSGSGSESEPGSGKNQQIITGLPQHHHPRPITDFQQIIGQ